MKLTSRWFSPKTIIKKSKLHGYGVFAKQDILKGEIILIAGGLIIHKKNIKEYRKINGNLGYQINENFFIVPINRKEIKNGGVNHSCNPNIGFDGDLTLKALKDIKKGEECTIEYCTYEDDLSSFDCNCGNKNCRKIITSDDWKNKKLQRKYKNNFSNYLKSKISKK